MADQRPITSFSSRTFDSPPATSAPDDDLSVPARLARLQTELQRSRDQTRANDEAVQAERYARWMAPSRYRRRRARDSPPNFSRQPSHTDSSLEETTQPRSAKRRKTTHHTKVEPNFRYGYYGQVEPGRLRLSLETCDGEVYQDEHSKVYLGPENIVKHDKSVYCSNAPRCNIILRHHDSSAFCLEKLYIIAPENGFTAPVKEGMVFIGMSRDELVPYLQSSVRLNNPVTRHRSPPVYERDTAQLSLMESLRDPEIGRALTQGRRRTFSPFDRTAEQTSQSPEHDETVNPCAISNDVTWPPLEPSRPYRRPPVTQQLSVCDESQDFAQDNDETHVVVLTDEEIGWPEDSTAAAVLADRQRRERRMRNILGEDSAWDARFSTRPSRFRRGHPQDWHNALDPRSLTGPRNELDKTEGVTRARFHIRDGKHKVAIKFDPPVSGTHILLKLETPYAGENIDLQTVIACGYAGQRFFPAVQPV